MNKHEKIMQAAALLLQQCKDIGGASMKLVFRDGDGKPVAAVIAVVGIEEATEVVESVEKIESVWNAE